MRRLTLLPFLLFLSLPKAFGQGNVTTYEYDDGGNVVKRSVTMRMSFAARSRAAKDTVQFASITYDRNRSVVAVLVGKSASDKEVSVTICNAATRLPMDDFTFLGDRRDYDISHYPKGIYIVEATCEGKTVSRKIAK